MLAYVFNCFRLFVSSRLFTDIWWVLLGFVGLIGVISIIRSIISPKINLKEF